jgi:hypothetical protein
MDATGKSELQRQKQQKLNSYNNLVFEIQIDQFLSCDEGSTQKKYMHFKI